MATIECLPNAGIDWSKALAFRLLLALMDQFGEVVHGISSRSRQLPT